MTSCPEPAGQSVCLRYPTRPIFRFGTRPSTDRAVIADPWRSRDHKRATLRTDLISIAPISGAPRLHRLSVLQLSRGSHATISGFRRQLEGRNSESLIYAFAGTLLQSASVLIFMPPIPIAQNEHFGIAGPPVDLEDAQRCVAGTAHPYAYFTPSEAPISPICGLSPEPGPPSRVFAMCR